MNPDSNTPAEPISWGIVGCGDVVERKAAGGIVAQANQKIVSAMRRDEEKLRRFAERFNVPHVTTDPQEVVNHPEVDMVYIATPPDLHQEYVELAVRAGKGVLVEKPVGRCAAETQAISQLCRDSGLPGFPSYYRRFQPKYQKVAELLRSGAIGSLVSVRYEFRERLPEKSGWRDDPARSGGGGFYDLAGHVLDVLDMCCGPLSFVSGDAQNLHPQHVTEHYTQLHFRGSSSDGNPVQGFASWNFAAIDKADELVFEGFHGRIRCQGLKQSGSVILEVDQTLQKTRKGSAINRTRKKLLNRFWPLRVEKWRFSKPDQTHEGLFAAIGRSWGAQGPNRQHLESAVRTSELMDQALASYYGGREHGFWNHPNRWKSLATVPRTLKNSETARYANDVTQAQVEQFRTLGFAGPFASDVLGLESLFVPVKERKNVHLEDPQFFRLCTHPSITQRVAVLVGSNELSVFKTRIHTKVGITSKTESKHSMIPWHQDAGGENGGYDADGKPVPTYTVWIALDDVGPQAGGLSFLPGTHTNLYGDFEKTFRANLMESGEVSEETVATAVLLTMKRGEFCVFHSWLLHGSAPNETPNRRTAFNIRYVDNAQMGTEEYPYVNLAPF